MRGARETLPTGACEAGGRLVACSAVLHGVGTDEQVHVHRRSDDETCQCDEVDHDDPAHFRVVIALSPSENQERDHADESGDERGRADVWHECGIDEKRAEKTEQNGPVTHEDGEVGSRDGNAVEGGEPVGSDDADEREKVDDPDDDERRTNEVSHGRSGRGVSHSRRWDAV